MPIPWAHLVPEDTTVEVMPIPEMSVDGAEEVQQMLQPISYTKPEGCSTLRRRAVQYKVIVCRFLVQMHCTGDRE